MGKGVIKGESGGGSEGGVNEGGGQLGGGGLHVWCWAEDGGGFWGENEGFLGGGQSRVGFGVRLRGFGVFLRGGRGGLWGGGVVNSDWVCTPFWGETETVWGPFWGGGAHQGWAAWCCTEGRRMDIRGLFNGGGLTGGAAPPRHRAVGVMGWTRGLFGGAAPLSTVLLVLQGVYGGVIWERGGGG